MKSADEPVRIDTIILDYGGVIAPVRRSEAFVEWAVAHYDVDPLQLRSIFKGPIYQDYQRGRIEEESFYRSIRELGLSAEARDLARVFVGFNRPDAEMVALIEDLQPKYDLCLVSDSTPELTRDVKRRFSSVFRVACFSDEHGYLKADRVLFDIALREIGAPGDACLYIDDRAENLVYPASNQVHGILFTGVAGLIDALRERYGILV